MSVTCSIAITVCKESKEIKQLVDFVLKYSKSTHEIVVLFDEANGDKKTLNILKTYETIDNIVIKTGEFDQHFANWKNTLNGYCTSDWILNLDADELPSRWLIKHLLRVVKWCSVFDLIWIPRKNIVTGLTSEDIKAWNWTVSTDQRVNWPDYQGRLYKNTPSIKWKNKVHEHISGAKRPLHIPTWLQSWIRIDHIKTIKKQRQQNELYSIIEE